MHPRSDPHRLERFRQAQASPAAGFDAALLEIRAGGKRGHWIWYVFPQLAGLGVSPMSREYAIHDAAEADAYLRDALLGPRFAIITEAVLERVRLGATLVELMGSEIDTRKLVSSLTLFRTVARQSVRAGDDVAARIAAAADELLRMAEQAGYAPCAVTVAALERS